MTQRPPAAATLVLLAAVACAAAQSLNVLDFGAIGDGRTDDTAAVRAALAATTAAGGGEVVFPAGYVFLTGAFNLTSNTVLNIAGTVRAQNSSSNGLFVVAAQLPWFGIGPVWQAFIHSDGANNLTLRGGGTVDGNGAAWWACGCKGGVGAAPPCSGLERPRLLNLIGGDGLLIEDLSFRNSPMWNLRPSHFKNIVMRRLNITAPNGVACNTDGIDLDGCQNAVVEDSYVSVGDDAIATKSGLDWYGRTYGQATRNVTFRRMRIGTGHGVSIGSEMSAGVYDVTHEDFYMEGTSTGPRIKTQRGRGGEVANIVFRNFTLHNVATAIQFTEYYEQSLPPQNASATPRFANFTVDGLVATGTITQGFYFNGLEESIISGVTLANIDIQGAKKPVGNCSFTTGLCLGNVKPVCPPCLTQQQEQEESRGR